MTKHPLIEIRNLKSRRGGKWVLNGVDLSIDRGEIIGIIGGSGAGKTTLLRAMLMLDPPQFGSIRIFDREVTTASPVGLLEIQRRWGVLFQQNALFSSLTVLENTAFPLQEHTSLDEQTIRDIALLKIMMAGLPVDSSVKYPAELSGGMQKRAGLARAIVMDPELLFLDEPTTGLDPKNVAAFDALILKLQSTMGLTTVIISHDIASLERVTNRVAFLGEGKVLSVGTIAELKKNPHKTIQEFFESVS